jgi:hypothetical protein
MRNLSIPTLEAVDSGFVGVDGIRYFATIYYPNGKADKRFWWINLCHVGGKSETFASAEGYLKRKTELTQLSLL